MPRKPASPAPAAALPTAAPAGASSDYRHTHQRDVVDRLKRIEGQVRGLILMIESGRPCEDVAQQMAAARKAMDKTFFRMMACTMMEAVTAPPGDSSVEGEVERATAILERYA
ncbi:MULTISPECIES: metal-sensitive transcriptional regulator [Hydrogenophaga]|uniref:Metal-sensitive transcriptional regulator n=2 Tax=Hydrogenophaga TaxID=47420 RepID=A0ABW2QE04_9BURK